MHFLRFGFGGPSFSPSLLALSCSLIANARFPYSPDRSRGLRTICIKQTVGSHSICSVAVSGVRVNAGGSWLLDHRENGALGESICALRGTELHWSWLIVEAAASMRFTAE
jgi:hypothetical protein